MILPWLTGAPCPAHRLPRRSRERKLAPIIESLEDRTLPSFSAPIDYQVGAGPHAIAVGDFNGDGKPDLATPSFYASPPMISVLLANGDGTFQSAVNVPIGAAPEDVEAADFNGDGKLDFAVATYGTSTVSVLLGNGNGTFQPAVNYQAGTKPYRIVVGDFNADGKVDLAVSNRGSSVSNGGVTILLGNGNGSFLTGTSYTTGPNAFGLASGDFNGDGKQDLVATAAGNPFQSSGNGVFILLGNGNGTFQGPSHFSFGTISSPDGVVVSDLNGDGKDDLAIANYYSNAVSVFLGNGNGTFATPVNYALGTAVHSFYFPNLAVADLNNDGKEDLVVADNGDSNVWVLLGNGNGSFQAGVNHDAGGSTQSVAVADLNGDGKLDVAAANIYGNSVTVLLGQADGSLPTVPTVTAGLDVLGVVATDFNGDGQADLATANYGSSSVSVLLGNGNGTFHLAINTPVGPGPQAIAAGDFNGDGKPDLVTANFKGATLSVLLGNGDGTFKAATNYFTDGVPYAVTVADVNGDGKADLLTANSATATVSVLLGNGNGTFKSAANYAVGSNPNEVVAADFNGDGKLDLAVSNRGSNTVSVLLGNGNGTFAAAGNIAAGTAPSSVVASDINGDGKPDVIVADGGAFNPSAAGVSILLGNGNGTFQPAVLLPAGSTPVAVAVGDFNGDGSPDLVVANIHGADISILLGNGNGTFQAAADYVAGAVPTVVAIGDLNGDHAPDLAVAGRFSSTITLLFDQPTATHFQVSVPAGANAGIPLSVTATALSNFGGPVSTYTGRVHFSSSDGQASLPTDYTFTSADIGVHTFSNGVLLKTAGGQTVTVSDTMISALTGAAVVPVSAAAATQLAIAAPSGNTAGVPFTVTVTAMDAYGNIAIGYAGTVHFTSSDTVAGLPADYTFIGGDAGVHTFANEVTLQTAGSQTVTATDTSTPWIGNGGNRGTGQTTTAQHKTSALISGTATVVVSAAPSPDEGGLAAALVDAYFGAAEWHAASGWQPSVIHCFAGTYWTWYTALRACAKRGQTP
jgi:hypothetical protein